MPDDFSSRFAATARSTDDGHLHHLIGSGPAQKPVPGPASPAQDCWLLEIFGLDVKRYGVLGKKSATLKKPDPPKPVPRAQLGEPQRKRATALLLKFPAADQKRLNAILTKAKPAEKSYVIKAIACGHTAGRVEDFYKQIAGKPATWLDTNLHITGDPSGKGVKQQWKDTCVPTTLQAMKGELDPIYALETRQINPNLSKTDDNNGLKTNPALAMEQKTLLVDNDGVATSRNTINGGIGMYVAPALETVKQTTGLTFKSTKLEPKTFNASMSSVAGAIKSGLPVPLEIGDDTGGHCVLITGTDKGPPRRYSIHDPMEGKLYTFTEQDLKDAFKKPNGGKFQIAGWKTLKFAYVPAMADTGGK